VYLLKQPFQYQLQRVVLYNQWLAYATQAIKHMQFNVIAFWQNML
jgi:hypothetical protein